MIAVGNLLQAVASALSFLCDALIILVFVRALLSWVSPDPSNPIVQFIVPFRNLIPAYKIGLDISPILAFFFLKFFVQMFIVRTLFAYAMRLG
jgi:YggT family protein